MASVWFIGSDSASTLQAKRQKLFSFCLQKLNFANHTLLALMLPSAEKWHMKIRTDMLYPIGIQSFSEIREGGYVYVDKTAAVYNLASTGEVWKESSHFHDGGIFQREERTFQWPGDSRP